MLAADLTEFLLIFADLNHIPRRTCQPIPNTGAEDFAFYMEKVPGVFLWLGVGNPEQGICQPWHSPKFRMDESALALGAAGFAQLAFDYVNEFKK